MWRNLTWLGISFIFVLQAYGQKTNFPTNPDQAKFVTQDIPHFWQAFDLFAGYAPKSVLELLPR